MKRTVISKFNYLEGLFKFFFLLIISFLFLTQSPLHIWRSSDSNTDSSVFQTVAMMMDKGYMPYRDTFDHKGPLTYLINYLGRHIVAYGGVWVIEFISLFVMLLFIYKISRLKCSKTLSYIVVLLSVSFLFDFFQGGNLVEEYAMSLIAGALFVFLDYFVYLKISTFRLMFCGLCFGGVCLLRPNMISVWLVFCIAVLMQCIGSKNYQNLKKFILYFLLGFFIIVFPVILWLIINNSFFAFWDEYIRFNFTYVSSRSSKMWSSFFSYFTKPLVMLSTIIAVYMSWKSKHQFLYGTYCCYIVCTVLFVCMAGGRHEHYGMIMVPVIAFPIASLFNLCIDRFSSNEREGKVEIFLIGLYLVLTIIIPSWLSTITGLSEIYNLRDADQHSGRVNMVCSIVRDNTKYDDKISVYGNWDIIYVMSDRAHATKYSYQFPIGFVRQNIMQEYFEGLKEEKPTIIVVQTGYYDTEIENFLSNNEYRLIWSEADNDNTQTLVYRR